jgi:hypothetical protein
VIADPASAAALVATLVACLLLVAWLLRRGSGPIADLEARLPRLTSEEEAEVRARVAAELAAAGRAGRPADPEALLARASREARMVKFRSAHRLY